MSKINITVGMRPQIIYRLEARKRDAAGNIVSRRTSVDIPNVFTNLGVEKMFEDPTATVPDRDNMAYMVGTSSAAPQITDSSLGSYVAGQRRQSGTDSTSFHDNEDGTGYIEFRQDALFAAGASGGNVNIAEVGAGISSGTPNSSTDLISRALVVDGVGDPAVFEWLEDEELLLTAFHRLHVSLEDVVLTNVPIDGDGPDQTITVRPHGFGFPGNNWKWPGYFSSAPSGIAFWGDVYNLPDIMASSGSSSGSGAGSANTSQGTQQGLEAYVPGSKKRTRWLRVPTGADRNVVGFQFSNGSGFGMWAVKLDPGIPKSDLHRCTFGLTFKIDNTI